MHQGCSTTTLLGGLVTDDATGASDVEVFDGDHESFGAFHTYFAAACAVTDQLGQGRRTGLVIAGTIAATEIGTKILIYYFHERAWTLVPWGRKRTL
jgi:uncharacterized membrane protein